MKTELKITNPDEIEASIIMTMTLKDWRHMRKQINDAAWPSCDLARQIDNLIIQSINVYYPKEEE